MHTPAEDMPANRLEQGLVPGTSALHAIRRTVRGLTAVCGAGAIVTVVAGRFNPGWRESCPDCAAEGDGSDASG